MMLLHDQDQGVVHQIREPSVDPCWIESRDESRLNFNGAKELLNGWFQFMSNKIHQLKTVDRVSVNEIQRYGKSILPL